MRWMVLAFAGDSTITRAEAETGVRERARRRVGKEKGRNRGRLRKEDRDDGARKAQEEGSMALR